MQCVLYFCRSTNNYTKVGGLQLDMAPAIGPLAAKVVIIDKSDHAEGTVQFAPEALQFKGSRARLETNCNHVISNVT